MTWLVGLACALTPTVEVDATLPYTSTGLWLQKGQRVRVRAEGSWSMWAGQWPDASADGYADAEHAGCPLGALVAHVGLAWSDVATPLCLGQRTLLVAPRDGYLWLGPNDGGVNDNLGAMRVALRGAGAPVAPLSVDTLRAGPPADLPPEVFVDGEHVAILLPRALLLENPSEVERAVGVLDAMYRAEAGVVAEAPYEGRRILFVPDASIEELGFMVAGNPVRFLPAVLEEGTDIRLLGLGDPTASHWSWAHELGHDFTMVVGDGRFMIGSAFVEAWANVPGLAALRSLGLPEADLRHPGHEGWRDGYGDAPAPVDGGPPEPCTAVPSYLASGSWADLEQDPWLALCLLFELQEAHGDDVLERFLRTWTAEEGARWPPHDADPALRWSFFREAFRQATGADPGPTLIRWHVPLTEPEAR